MKYTARDESQVANIAQGKAKYYICHETLTKSCIPSYKRSGSASSVLLYFTLKELLTKYTSLKFNVLSIHLWNKQNIPVVFFNKNVSIVLPFYNYSSVL